MRQASFSLPALMLGVMLSSLSFVQAETLTTARVHYFDITLNFGSGLTVDDQAVFVQAANYWKSVITGYAATNGVSLAGLTISVSAATDDGAGGGLAYTSIGSSLTEYTDDDVAYTYPKSASIVIDSDDIATMTTAGTFYPVVLHEMAHSLGFGTLWLQNGVYTQGSGQYTGAAALAAYRTEFNQSDATFVPVELEGGLGTANCHWNENNGGAGTTGIVDSRGRDMQFELMTGWVNLPASSLFISQTTIYSFEDIGYILVPEPGAMALLTVAVGLAFWLGRRRPFFAA